MKYNLVQRYDIFLNSARKAIKNQLKDFRSNKEVPINTQKLANT